ncbi:MAG: GDP-L-fucose synthase [Pseudomonadota bacterium]
MATRRWTRPTRRDFGAAPPFSLAGTRVWVAGHRGMVGSAILRRLASEDCEIVTAPRDQVDLEDPHAVGAFLTNEKPDVVFVAAAKVGGILANDTQPVDFLHANLMIGANIMRAAWRSGVRKLLYLGSSCIYPRDAAQPITEDALLTGRLEPTNEAYAIAKIAGVKLAQAYRRQYGCDFISAMPTNLYGPGDRFDLTAGHVLPALMRKAHEAKVTGADRMVVWGTGQARREFMHVEDCADACLHLMRHYSAAEPVNVGTGGDIRIADLARRVCDVVGYNGPIVMDPSKPHGTPRKLMSSARLRAMGWSPHIGLEAGLVDTYEWFLKHEAALA